MFAFRFFSLPCSKVALSNFKSSWLSKTVFIVALLCIFSGFIFQATDAIDDDQDADEEEQSDDEADEQDEGDEEDSDESDDESDDEPELAENELDVSHDKIYIIDGEEVTGAQLKSERMAHAEFTRKTQEIAAERKEGSAAIAAEQSQLANALQFTLGNQRQLLDSAINNTDWQRLKVEDPAKYQEGQKHLQQLNASVQQTEQNFKQFVGRVESQKKKELDDAVSETLAALPTAIEGWSDEVASDLTDYAIKCGIPENQVAQITNLPALVMMHKAMQFDALQKPSTATKKVKTVTRSTTKKASKSKASAKAQKAKASKSRFAKTGSIDDAVDLLLS